MCMPPQWPPDPPTLHLIPTQKVSRMSADEKRVYAQHMLRQASDRKNRARERDRRWEELVAIARGRRLAKRIPSLWSRLKSRASRVTWDSWG